RVIPWTAADIDEVYRLRALLEGYGAGPRPPRARDEQVAELRQLEDRYERALDHGRVDASAECNNEFHAAVLRASGSGRLGTLVAVVASAPLVHRALQHYTDDDQRGSVVQHRD